MQGALEAPARRVAECRAETLHDPALVQPTPGEVHAESKCERNQARDERRVEAVPKREMQVNRSLKDASLCRLKQGVVHQRRVETDDESQSSKRAGAEVHAERRFVRLAGERALHLAEERFHAHEQPGRDQRHVGQDARDEDDRPPVGSVQGGLIRHLFPDEPEERRDARHRERCGESAGHRDGHGYPKTAEFGQVSRPGFVVDVAGEHEEGALVERVHQRERHHRLDGGFRADAEQHREKAQHHRRSVGEDLLQIGVPQRQPGG